MQSCTAGSLNTGRLTFHQKHSQGRILPHGETGKQRKNLLLQELATVCKNKKIMIKTVIEEKTEITKFIVTQSKKSSRDEDKKLVQKCGMKNAKVIEKMDD